MISQNGWSPCTRLRNGTSAAAPPSLTCTLFDSVFSFFVAHSGGHFLFPSMSHPKERDNLLLAVALEVVGVECQTRSLGFLDAVEPERLAGVKMKLPPPLQPD